jgi:hypothetical protein
VGNQQEGLVGNGNETGRNMLSKILFEGGTSPVCPWYRRDSIIEVEGKECEFAG